VSAPGFLLQGFSMKPRNFFIICCMAVFALAAPVPSSAKNAKPAKKTASATATEAPISVEAYAPDNVPENVKQELAGAARTLVGNAAKNIMPNSKNKEVAQGSNGEYVASYTEVDVSHVRADVIPSSESGKYVGSIRYAEKQYECPGKNKADALKAECRAVKSRKMNELIRYEKGKWHY
jgi:hypothetical protein